MHMKNFFLILSTLTALTFQAKANEIYASGLTAFSVTPQMQDEIGLRNINSGALLVDLDQRLITLKLASQYKCPTPNCPHALIAPVTLQLPLVSIEMDMCDVPHFIGKLNGQSIEVEMTSVSHCMYAFGGPTFRMPAPTSVTYSVESQAAPAKFEGTALQPLKLKNP